MACCVVLSRAVGAGRRRVTGVLGRLVLEAAVLLEESRVDGPDGTAAVLGDDDLGAVALTVLGRARRRGLGRCTGSACLPGPGH